MQRDKAAAALQQFFALSVSLNKEKVISRDTFGVDHDLVINLGEITPFAFFTGFLNAIGQDPLCRLIDIDELMNELCDLFGVVRIIFVLQVKNRDYMELDIEGDKSWLTMDKDPNRVLPNFERAKWNKVKK